MSHIWSKKVSRSSLMDQVRKCVCVSVGVADVAVVAVVENG